MKKILYTILLVLMVAGTSYGKGFYAGGGGVLTDTNCDQAKYYPLGTLCQDTDDGKLYKGTGAAVEEIASGAGFSVTDITGATDDSTPATTATAVLAQGGSLIESTIAQIGTAIGVIDWTSDQGATNIHAGNIPDLSSVYHPLWDYDYGDLINTPTIPTVNDSITDSNTTSAPSENAVFDALALKLTITANTIDAIGDAAADGTVNFAGYKIIWTSTLNSAGAVHTFTNTTADLTADVSFMDFKYTDDGDANGYFFRGYDNSGNDLKWYIGSGGAAYFDSISVANGYTIAGSSSGGQYLYLLEDTDNGSNYGGFGVYGDLAHDTIYAYPLAAPVTGQVMSWATPGNQTMSDGSTQSVSVGTFAYKDYAQTPVIGDADDFDDNCTGACLYGGTFIVTAAGTAVLPNATAGMNFTIILEGANATIIDPLGTGTADAIHMNGLAAADDENITSSTSGATCVIQYRSADHWSATCNGFAEATPPE